MLRTNTATCWLEVCLLLYIHLCEDKWGRFRKVKTFCLVIRFRFRVGTRERWSPQVQTCVCVCVSGAADGFLSCRHSGVSFQIRDRKRCFQLIGRCDRKLCFGCPGDL